MDTSDVQRVRSLEERLARLEAENQRLKEEQAELSRCLLNIAGQHAATVEKLDGRLAQAQFRANQAQRDAQSILNSRIWKSMVRVSGAALSLAAARRRVRWPGRNGAPATGARETVHLIYEQPTLELGAPLSGTILISGWAVATTGIERIELLAPNLPPQAVTYGLHRPDVAILHPSIEGSSRSGFSTLFDTSTLRTGSHTVALRAVSKGGTEHLSELHLAVDHINGYSSAYQRWIQEFDTRDERLIHLKLNSLSRRPLVSVILPVYRTNPAILKKAIESVVGQSYPEWELCVVDDASGSAEIDRILEEYSQRESRIRTLRRERNGGISAASNHGLRLASGEYVALLDHDDEFAPDALLHAMTEVDERPETDLLYSDEDHIDENGHRFDPFFKPDWSPDLILSENYVCHLMVFRKSLAESAGGFRTVTDLSQDHDILLRMSRRARRIAHIPRILYHWRTEVETVQRASASEEKAFESSFQAVNNFVQATESGAEVVRGCYPGRWRVRRSLPATTTLSIIIPSGGKTEVLGANLASLFGKTQHTGFEVLVADNSKGNAVADLTGQLRRKFSRIRYLDLRGLPFNYSHLNNRAAAECNSDLLLFLNDDTSVVEEGSIEALMEQAIRAEVGAVGAKLLYPDGRIQHGGIAMGVLGVCGHEFKGLPGDQRYYFDFPDVIRNVSAVTGACLMTRADVFREVGGFDEVHFPVAYNDVDLCLKIGKAGYRVLYTPHAVLNHFEAFSKGVRDLDPTTRERQALMAKWADVIENDPYYSPNLSRTDERYSPRRKGIGQMN